MKPSQKIRAVVSDFDGTLVDPTEAFALAMDAAIERLNLPTPSKSRLIELAKSPLHKSLLKIIPSEKLDRAGFIRRFFDEYRKAYARVHLEYIRLMPEVFSTLREIYNSGILIGVVSSRRLTGDFVKEEIEFLKLDKFIQALVIIHKTQIRSKKDLIYECIKRLGVKPINCVVVGDSPEDMEAGRDIGALTVGVLYGFSNEKKLRGSKPNVLIKNLPEIIDLLEMML